MSVRRFTYTITLVSCLSALWFGGCENKPHDITTAKPSRAALSLAELAGEAYQPVKVSFLPLTEITPAQTADKPGKITAYVCLIDAADSAIKFPGAFRFELYNYSHNLIDQKGKRLAIWQDQNLSGFADNNTYWQDYLRSYKFELAFDPASEKQYLLIVTYKSPSGKNIAGRIILRKD